MKDIINRNKFLLKEAFSEINQLKNKEKCTLNIENSSKEKLIQIKSELNSNQKDLKTGLVLSNDENERNEIINQINENKEAISLINIYIKSDFSEYNNDLYGISSDLEENLLITNKIKASVRGIDEKIICDNEKIEEIQYKFSNLEEKTKLNYNLFMNSIVERPKWKLFLIISVECLVVLLLLIL